MSLVSLPPSPSAEGGLPYTGKRSNQRMNIRSPLVAAALALATPPAARAARSRSAVRWTASPGVWWWN